MQPAARRQRWEWTLVIKLSLRKRSGEVFQPTNRNDFHFWCILKEQPEMPDPSRSKVRPRRDHSATRRMCLWCGCYAHSNWSDRGTGGGIAQGQNFSCIVLRDLSWCVHCPRTCGCTQPDSGLFVDNGCRQLCQKEEELLGRNL